MGKIEGVSIKNFGPLKDIVMGKQRTKQKETALGNVTVIIGPSGNGKVRLQMRLDFWLIAWNLGLRKPAIRKTGVDFNKSVHRE